MSFIVDSVTLPSPDFGDTSALVVKMNTHRSMSGRLYTYIHKPVGPDSEILKKLSYTFSNVTYAIYVTLIAALDALTTTFTITDQNSVAWTVNILSVQTSITFEGRKVSAVDFSYQECIDYTSASHTDLGTISLSFEGYLDA